MQTPKSIGLTGFPNAGKTTVFNQLTDSKNTVQNWPGVTTEHATKSIVFAEEQLTIHDLPSSPKFHATHAINPETNQPFDKIVYVLDATCFTQQMPMLLEWCETTYPMVLVLTKYEQAQALGLMVDCKVLGKHLGIPVCIQEDSNAFKYSLLHTLTQVGRRKGHKTHWSESLRQKEETLKEKTTGLPKPWHGIPHLHLMINAATAPKTLKPYTKTHGLDKKQTDKQLCTCRKALLETLKNEKAWRYNPPLSHSRVDAILIHPLAGPLCMGAILYMLFFACSTLTQCLQPIIDVLSFWGYQQSLLLLEQYTSHALLGACLHGLFIGLNTTLTFLPMIFLLYMGLSWMEQSGYTLRISYITHKWMRALRLPGKALIPLLLGFSCNVPAIFGARILRHPAQRVVTSLISPFVPCSARLAVFTLMGLSLFPAQKAVLFIGALYGTSLITAFLCGILFSRWLSLPEGERALPLLPAYTLPSLATLATSTWDKSKLFLLRAGRIILPASTILVAFSHTLPKHANHFPMTWLAPLGIAPDHWQVGLGLLTGIVAKEVMIGSLSALYHPSLSDGFGLEGSTLTQAPQLIWEAICNIPNHFIHPFSSALADAPSHTLLKPFVAQFPSIEAAIAFALFTALYIPCISTITTLYKEFSRPWALFSALWSVLLAYFVASNFYQWAHGEPGAWLWSLASTTLMLIIGLLCKRWLQHHLPTLLKTTPTYTSPTCAKGCASPCRD